MHIALIILISAMIGIVGILVLAYLMHRSGRKSLLSMICKMGVGDVQSIIAEVKGPFQAISKLDLTTCSIESLSEWLETNIPRIDIQNKFVKPRIGYYWIICFGVIFGEKIAKTHSQLKWTDSEDGPLLKASKGDKSLSLFPIEKIYKQYGTRAEGDLLAYVSEIGPALVGLSLQPTDSEL